MDDRERRELVNEIKNHVSEINVAVVAASKMGLKVEFDISNQIGVNIGGEGNAWPTPIISVQVSQPL